MLTFTPQEHVSLQSYNTLAVPVVARWFANIENYEQLEEALSFVDQQQCSLMVLGGGSNVVLTNNFSGLCLHIGLRGRSIESETDDQVLLSVAAGESWHETVMYCVQQGYYGIENLALIPGTVGAAPIQNIGAYGVELCDCFHSLEAIDIKTGKMMVLDKASCQFAYRDSVFKGELKDRVVITRVVLQLSKRPAFSISYPALASALSGHKRENLDAVVIAEAVIAIRQSKLPDPKEIPNAGSFFKNPIVSHELYHRLLRKYTGLVAFPQGENYKLAAGWLLDQAGWRGKVVDGICMHKQQALVLTNPNRASGESLLAFVDVVKRDIEQRYGVTLEVEPRIF